MLYLEDSFEYISDIGKKENNLWINLKKCVVKRKKMLHCGICCAMIDYNQ